MAPKAHAATAGTRPASALAGTPCTLQAHGAPTIRHSQSASRRVLSRRSATRHASPGAARRLRMVRREGRNVPACAHLSVRLAPTINWCQQYSTPCAHAPPLFTLNGPCRFLSSQGHSRSPQAAPDCHGTNAPAPALSSYTSAHRAPPTSPRTATMHPPPLSTAHAHPCTPIHAHHPRLPPAPSARAAPRTRKGPPPCGSGPYCVMPRAGVSPARFRAGAPPARQGR